MFFFFQNFKSKSNYVFFFFDFSFIGWQIFFDKYIINIGNVCVFLCLCFFYLFWFSVSKLISLCIYICLWACVCLESNIKNVNFVYILSFPYILSLTQFILPCILIGEYSCLKVDLLFKREFSYYLIQIYIPCCMLVIVSWVSFWLDQGAVPARVSLGK